MVRWQMDDGTMFKKKSDAEKYDYYLQKVKNLLDHLPMKAKNNKEGYIQHSPGIGHFLEKELVKLGNKYFETSFEHFSYPLGRYIRDNNMKCLERLLNVVSCMDDDDRQWNQPYYAQHPEKGTQIQLNP